MGSASTFEGVAEQEAARRPRRGRHVGTAALALVVVVALTGLFGPRTAIATSRGAGYAVELNYGSVVRSGQPVPLTVTVTHSGGFKGPVTIAFDRDVFERLDFQNWYPNPAEETGDEDKVVYQFSPPPGDTLTVVLDARVAPLQIGGHFSYWLALVVDGRQVDRLDYAVWVMP